MRVVIFAGGHGTRLQEHTDRLPKPLVEIGGKPILWHIMKLYSFQGFNDFIILAGYKQHLIKEYFYNYFLHRSNVYIDLKKNEFIYLDNDCKDWKISIIDTGFETLTGDRLAQVQQFLADENFMLTYGDGLCTIPLNNLLHYHNKHKAVVTITAVQPEGRFGKLIIDKYDRVEKYEEKPLGDDSWINGGFMVCNFTIFDFLQKGDFANTLVKLSEEKRLCAAKFDGFWKAMDVTKDKNILEELWKSEKCPWKIW